MAAAEARLDSIERLAERRDNEDVARILLVRAAFELDLTDAESRELRIEMLEIALLLDTPKFAEAIEDERKSLSLETNDLAADREEVEKDLIEVTRPLETARLLEDDVLRSAVADDAAALADDSSNLVEARLELVENRLFADKSTAALYAERAEARELDSEKREVVTASRLDPAIELLTSLVDAATELLDDLRYAASELLVTVESEAVILLCDLENAAIELLTPLLDAATELLDAATELLDSSGVCTCLW